MNKVVKINCPSDINAALKQGYKIIRFGEEFCPYRAEVVWPVEIILEVLELLTERQARGELVWLVSPTSQEEESYLDGLADILRKYRETARPVISDWGSLRQYQDLKPVAGERLLIYNSLNLKLLKELGGEIFYLAPDLDTMERKELVESALNLGLKPALNLLSPVLMVSWTCVYREATKEFSKTCRASCHPRPPVLKADAVPLYYLDGHVVRGAVPLKPEAAELSLCSRVLTAEI